MKEMPLVNPFHRRNVIVDLDSFGELMQISPFEVKDAR